MSKKNILELAARERQAFRTSRLAHDREASWIALEREHILAQGFFWPHIRSHVAMLGYACETRDGPEIRGQIIRLALAPFGNVTRNLPLGNTGRANVSAFKSMPYPEDLALALSISREEEG